MVRIVTVAAAGLLAGCACLPAAPLYSPLPVERPSSDTSVVPGDPPGTPPSQPPGQPPVEPVGKNNKGHGNANENTDPQLNGLAGVNRDGDNPGKKK